MSCWAAYLVELQGCGDLSSNEGLVSGNSAPQDCLRVPSGLLQPVFAMEEVTHCWWLLETLAHSCRCHSQAYGSPPAARVSRGSRGRHPRAFRIWRTTCQDSPSLGRAPSARGLLSNETLGIVLSKNVWQLKRWSGHHPPGWIHTPCLEVENWVYLT